LFGLILCLFTGAKAQSTEAAIEELSPSVFKAELELSASLEPRRAEFEAIMVNAQKRLLVFAQKYEWSHLMEEPLMRKALIFDQKEGYDRFLKELYPPVSILAPA
jgi:hypothetical protein